MNNNYEKNMGNKNKIEKTHLLQLAQVANNAGPSKGLGHCPREIAGRFCVSTLAHRTGWTFLTNLERENHGRDSDTGNSGL